VSQVGFSFSFPIVGFPFEPSRLWRHPSIGTLFVERFSLGACWAFSFQQVLLPDKSTWAPIC